MKIFVFLVLLSLAAGVSSTCDTSGVKKCVAHLIKDITTNFFTSSTCTLMDNYATCVGSLISTCPAAGKEEAQKALDNFNKQYGCKTKFSSAPATGVSSTCNTTECVAHLLKDIAANTSSTCTLMDYYAECVGPVISSCDSSGKEKAKNALDDFNKQYDCNAKLTGHAFVTTATFLTLTMAAIAARFN